MKNIFAQLFFAITLLSSFLAAGQTAAPEISDQQAEAYKDLCLGVANLEAQTKGITFLFPMQAMIINHDRSMTTVYATGKLAPAYRRVGLVSDTVHFMRTCKNGKIL